LIEINLGRAKKGQEPRPKSESVFPSKRHFTEPMAWIQKAAKRIRDASEVQFRPHDLRRTAASHMTRTGTPRLVVAKILNHKDSGVTAVYDRHSYDLEKSDAINKWGLLVEEMLTKREGAKVIPMESTGTAGQPRRWATFKLPKGKTPRA
jgi:integrase